MSAQDIYVDRYIERLNQNRPTHEDMKADDAAHRLQMADTTRIALRTKNVKNKRFIHRREV